MKTRISPSARASAKAADDDLLTATRHELFEAPGRRLAGIPRPPGNGEVRGLEVSPDWNSAPPQLICRQRIGPGRLFAQEQARQTEAVVSRSLSFREIVEPTQKTSNRQQSIAGIQSRFASEMPVCPDGSVDALAPPA
jgi:hypothetical protein